MKNQQKTENILEVIQDFLSPHSEGAILINGSWGSGKTHFWKNEILPVVKNKNFKAVYISLNGISNFSDLEHLTLVTILGTLDNSEKKFFQKSAGIIMNIVNKAGSIFLKNSLSDIAKTVGLNKISLSQFVFCFDDLERSNLRITQVLGFINSLMEHQKAKILILADESKIPDFKEYQLHKEKLLKWSLKFERNYDNIASILLERAKQIQIEFYQFLMKHYKWLEYSLTTLEVKNIRTLYFALELYHKIKPRLNQQGDKYQLEIFWFVLTISQEFKAGKLFDSQNFLELDTIGQSFHFYLAKQNKEEGNSFAFTFFKRYFHETERDYFFYKSIFSFVLTGYLDFEAFKEEILERVPDPEKPEEVAKEELLTYYFRKIEEERFIFLTEEVWKYANNGQYVIYDYVRIAHFFYFFSENNLIDKSEKEVKSMIEEGLNKSSNISQFNDDAFDNLFAFSSEIEREKNIKLQVKSIHKSLKEKSQRNQFNLLLNKFNKDEDSIKSFFDDHKFQKELFSLIDAEQFFIALSGCDNSHLQLIKEKIKDRYASNTIKEFYSKDLEFVKKLLAMLEEALLNQQFKGRIKIFLIKEIIRELKSAMDKLG